MLLNLLGRFSLVPSFCSNFWFEHLQLGSTSIWFSYVWFTLSSIQICFGFGFNLRNFLFGLVLNFNNLALCLQQFILVEIWFSFFFGLALDLANFFTWEEDMFGFLNKALVFGFSAIQSRQLDNSLGYFSNSAICFQQLGSWQLIFSNSFSNQHQDFKKLRNFASAFQQLQ